MSFKVKKEAPFGKLRTGKKEYVSDSIGNRVSSEDSGQTTEYQANQLNQYSSTTSNSATNNFSFDADGNMLSNNGWVYEWNGENRLISASNGTTVVTFKYDYMGRRFSKTVDSSETLFVYDGWNLIQESNNSATNNYVWGLDLSQTLQGAGGVGGLLSVTESDGSVYFAIADANGNVTGYIDDSGNVKAVYEFDAFGGIVSSSGAKKDDFKFRFSTKYQDSTGLYYYGYRYYDAELGRFITEDPLREISFIDQNPILSFMGYASTGESLIHAFMFNHNNGIDNIDVLGLCDTSCQDSSVSFTFSKTLMTGIGKYTVAYTGQQKINRCGIVCNDCSCGIKGRTETTHSGGTRGSWPVMVGGYPFNIGFGWTMAGTKYHEFNTCDNTDRKWGCNTLSFSVFGEVCVPPAPLVRVCLRCSLGVKLTQCEGEPEQWSSTGGCMLRFCGFGACINKPLF